MKKAIVFGITMVVLLAANMVQAEGCEILNGSFEDDSYVDFPPSPNEPNGWDVNIPDYNKFDGYIHRDWPTDGIYNLTLYSEWFQTFEINDMAIVSQQVDLTDANEIIFDLKLGRWEPDIFAAVVLIDDDVVWDSNDLGSGTYYDRIYTVEDKYRNGALHTLAFGIKAIVDIPDILWNRYFTDWDYIECTEFCGGGGLLAGDFNHDCYVDYNDLKLFADLWLSEVEKYDRYNLFKGDDTGEDGGTVTFRDFAVFGLNWLESSYPE